MTPLSDDELRAIHEQTDAAPRNAARSSGRHARREDVSSFDLVKQPDDGPALAALATISAQLASAFEDALATRTHRAWAVDVREPRRATAVELVSALSAPVIAWWPGSGAALIIDGETAQRLVSLWLGFEDQADGGAVLTSTAGMLGSLDKPVIGRLLRGIAAELVPALALAGAKLDGDVEVDLEWRRLAPRLRDAALAIIPVELAEPLRARIELVVPLSALPHQQQTSGTSGTSGTRGAHAQSRAAKPGGGGAAPATGRIADHLTQLDVDVAVELGALTMSIEELTQLRPGMVLSLGTTEAAPLAVLVEGQARFAGRPSAEDGRISVTLVRPAG